MRTWRLQGMGKIYEGVRQLVRFGLLQARCCAFAVALVGGIAVSGLLPELPLARYDLVLLYGIGLAVVARWVGWDSARDTVVIAGCHLVGLLFELVKVRLGSWSYPEDAVTKVAGVPLYGGFLYAAVGSYVCRSWELLDLRLSGYRPSVMAWLAGAVYVNFFSHHWLPDARWVLAVAMLCATAGTWVRYTVGERHYRMPLALAFVLIGFFLWVAENAATYARRVELSGPAGRLAAGVGREVRGLGAADQRDVRDGRACEGAGSTGPRAGLGLGRRGAIGP